MKKEKLGTVSVKEIRRSLALASVEKRMKRRGHMPYTFRQREEGGFRLAGKKKKKTC